MGGINIIIIVDNLKVESPFPKKYENMSLAGPGLVGRGSSIWKQISLHFCTNYIYILQIYHYLTLKYFCSIISMASNTWVIMSNCRLSGADSSEFSRVFQVPTEMLTTILTMLRNPKVKIKVWRICP